LLPIEPFQGLGVLPLLLLLPLLIFLRYPLYFPLWTILVLFGVDWLMSNQRYDPPHSVPTPQGFGIPCVPLRPIYQGFVVYLWTMDEVDVADLQDFG
jgi:hypothetical protein